MATLVKDYTIENKTILIPYIICEHSIWEYLDNDAVLKQLEPQQCAEIVEYITPSMCERANYLFKNNTHFRKGITSNEKGRDKLAMWFYHWSAGAIKEYFKTHKKDFALPI